MHRPNWIGLDMLRGAAVCRRESRKGERRDDAGDHASKKSECDHDGRHETSMPISAREQTVGAPARLGA
jgi:hypothetical protein